MKAIVSSGETVSGEVSCTICVLVFIYYFATDDIYNTWSYARERNYCFSNSVNPGNLLFSLQLTGRINRFDLGEPQKSTIMSSANLKDVPLCPQRTLFLM